MTVGLPGSGIGGVFYLLSALFMPVHSALRQAVIALGLRERGNRRPDWVLIWRQFGIAAGIIASLWTAGWLLAELLIAHPTALGQAQTTEIGRKLPNILRAGAVIVSLSTLVGVLAAVQIARLVVTSLEAKAGAEKAATALKIAAALLFMIATPSALAQSPRIVVADSAFAAEDRETAKREYEAALRENPESSRALYRLGQLSRTKPHEAEKYFRRYANLEPQDAWGWIALGDALSAQRKYGDALRAYASAVKIAPAERDVVIGRARVLAAAGRTDESIRAYESWTSVHPQDAEAERELAVQQRRAGRYREAARTFSASNASEQNEKAARGISASSGFAAPAVEISTAASGDTEENQAVRVGAGVSAQIGDRARLVASGGKRWLTGFFDATVEDGSIGIVSRPLAAFRFELSGGVARPHNISRVTDTIPGTGTGSGNGGGRGRGNRGGAPPPGTIIQTESEMSDNIFVGGARGVLRIPGGRSSLDLRVTRSLLDATSVLVINRVVRNEFAGRADLEVFPRVKLRTGGRAAQYSAADETNSRVSLLGGVAVAATDAIEVSGVFQRLTFGHATTSGYFAPEQAELAEVGTYAEFESSSGVVLAIDAGAGAQRLKEFSTSMGKWEPSYRLFASLDVPFKPGSALHLELDSYDSRLGSDAPSSESSWRSVSFSASLRLALR